MKLLLMIVSLSAGTWAALETKAWVLHAACVVQAGSQPSPEAAAERLAACG